MATLALPKSIDYAQPLETLPAGTQSFQVVCNPVSGSTFGPNSQIDIELGSRGFLVPDSLMIRYTITTANSAECYMCGTPVYSPFLRLNTMINSQTVESIQNYNVLANLRSNLLMDVAQKYGQQSAFGYSDNSPTLAVSPVNSLPESLDGGVFEANGNKALSAPLPCALSDAEKMIPLFALNGVRLTFTLDTIASIFSTVKAWADSTVLGTPENAPLPTNFTISNFEVVYQCVDLGREVENMVMSQGPLRIKSTTWSSAIQSIPSGASGQLSLVYNQKYSSIKSLFLTFGGTNRPTASTTAVSANGNMDSFDVSSGGDFQFQVAGVSYPQRALSAGLNKGGILQQLRLAIGSVADRNNTMSINSREWNTVAAPASVTYTDVPAKFIVGCSLEKLRMARGGFFSGTSTENSAIVAQVRLAAATTYIYNAILTVCADYVYQVDPATRQVMIIS